MYVRSVFLVNYRSFANATVSLNRHCLLVGANNAGKTSLIEAIDKAFGVGRRAYGFTEGDLRAGADGPLRIEFELWPDDGQTFSAEEHGVFGTRVEFTPDNHERLRIRFLGETEDDGVFRVSAEYARLDGTPAGPFDYRGRQFLSFYYLPAVRDLSREMRDRNGLWSRLINAVRDDIDPANLEQVAHDAGRQLAEAAVGARPLDEVGTAISDGLRLATGNDMPITAEIRAAPVNIDQVIRSMSVMITGTDPTVRLALDEQSTGFQTLALIGLFRALLQHQGVGALGIGIEEPEAHLSPHTSRSVAAMLVNTPQQVLVTTHSPSIAQMFSPFDTLLLKRHETDGTTVSAPGPVTDGTEKAHVERLIRDRAPEFLFARAVILVEGDSEVGVLPAFASQLGLDLNAAQVSIWPVGGAGFRPWLRLLGNPGLRIRHICLSDGDLTGERLIRSMQELGRIPVDVADPAALASAGVHILLGSDLERYMVAEGGYPAFDAAIDRLFGPGALAEYHATHSPQDEAQAVTSFVRRRSYRGLSVRKPEIAAEAAYEFGRLGLGVPPILERVLRSAVNAGAV